MQNRMGDKWLNNYLVTYIERDTFVGIENEKIIMCVCVWCESS